MTAGASQFASGLTVRPARVDEIPQLDRLIAASARILSRGYYTADETEAAIEHVFGVDTDLIADGSYLIVEDMNGIVGCGGWSRRKTLFGGDRFTARTPGFLDPAVDAARIRAFFVAPQVARRGVGAALLAACERHARDAGFARTALMATLPGVPFYGRHGYVADEPITQLCGEIPVRFVPMTKNMLHI